MNYLLAVPNDENGRAFSQSIQKTLASNKDFLGIETLDIVTSVAEVMAFVEEHPVHVLIALKDISANTSDNFKVSDIETLLRDYPNMQMILAVPDDLKGMDYMLDLFKVGFYNSLFYKDTRPKAFINLIQNSRSENDTLAYYGIEAAAAEFLRERKKAEKRARRQREESERRALVEEEVKKSKSKPRFKGFFDSLKKSEKDSEPDMTAQPEEAAMITMNSTSDRAECTPMAEEMECHVSDCIEHENGRTDDSAANDKVADDKVANDKAADDRAAAVKESSSVASVVVECRIVALGADGKALIAPVSGDFSGARLNDLCVVIKS